VGLPRADNELQMTMTVLIVDDHATFRSVARKVLEHHGYEVIGEAPDGEQALEAVRELRPDLVLLDVQLPGIDGFEVAARLTSNGDAPAVVMVSSRDAADFGDLIARSGARGFIPKHDLSGQALEAILE
jgi:DNA-binding NarL/FixJ family response regulator